MRRRARNAVLRGPAAGRAVSRRHGRFPDASTVDRSRARSAIAIGMAGSLRSAGTAGRTSMPGCPRGLGDGLPSIIRGRTWTRRRLRKRHSAECGEGNLFLHGTGAGAIAWRPPPGTLRASLHVIEVAATSRATSATTAEGASTTCPAIATKNARASAPRAVSGISALKPKSGRPAGGERAGDRAHRGDGWACTVDDRVLLQAGLSPALRRRRQKGSSSSGSSAPVRLRMDIVVANLSR